MNSIVCLLEETASKLPQAIALEDSEEEMTYSTLRTTARSVATALLRAGGSYREDPGKSSSLLHHHL